MNLILFLQNIRLAQGGFFDVVFLGFSRLGDGVITYLLLAWVYWCIDKSWGRQMAMNLSLAGWGNQWLKKMLKIERPWIIDDRIVPVQAAIDDATGYSLPSGGTQKAVATWGVYGYLSGVKTCRTIIGFLIFLTAFSGIYLGTHTLYDELAACLLGAFVMLISNWLLEWMEAGRGYRDILVAVFLCLLVTGSSFHLGILSNAGISYGLIIGCTLEKRFIHFEAADSWRRRLARIITGGAVICLIHVFGNYFSYIVPQGYETFATNFTVAFFIAALYPLIFTRFEQGMYRVLLNGFMQTFILLALILGMIKLQNYISYSQNAYDVIAMGGYSSVAPANTVQALEDAIDIGADYIELDVQLTKDGQPVVYSEKSLYSATGTVGGISSYTYEELQKLDISWGFEGQDSGINYYDSRANYGKASIMTLKEALSIVKKGDGYTIIKLLDYSKDPENTKAAQTIVDTVGKSLMLSGVIYASDDLLKLRQFRTLDSGSSLMYCMDSDRSVSDAIKNGWADIYCGDRKTFTNGLVEKIHEAGYKCFLADAKELADMEYAVKYSLDGVCTSRVGLAKVTTKANSSYLTENYIDSFTVPTLYDAMTSKEYKNFILQGMTRVGNYTLYSAYDGSGRKNSVLYLANSQGQLMRIFDLGFKAHLGGIAYDESHQLLWLTASRGQVYGISWQSLTREDMVDIVYKFDAGLYNHSGEHVASFLAIDGENQLYVGSYCVGQSGFMNQYDIDDMLENRNNTPKLKYSIPTKVQGVTFGLGEERRVYFTQSDGYKNSKLLAQDFTYGNLDYSQAEVFAELPCMVEQSCMTDQGLYILFESSARKYRAIYRIPNDQVWLVEAE